MLFYVLYVFQALVHFMIDHIHMHKYRGHFLIEGYFLKTVAYPMIYSHAKEPVTKGHRSCRDTCHEGTPVM